MRKPKKLTDEQVSTLLSEAAAGWPSAHEGDQGLITTFEDVTGQRYYEMSDGLMMAIDSAEWTVTSPDSSSAARIKQTKNLHQVLVKYEAA